MRKASVLYAIIYGVMITSHGCFGMDDSEWQVKEVFKSSQLIQDKRVLNIYYLKDDCYAELQSLDPSLGGENAKKISNFGTSCEQIKKILKLKIDSCDNNPLLIIPCTEDEGLFLNSDARKLRLDTPLCLSVVTGNSSGPQTIRIASLKLFHGPKEYHNLPCCTVSTNGFFMGIDYFCDTWKEMQIYKQENIRNIIDVLRKNKSCLVKLEQKGNKNLLLKVGNYTRSAWFSWNGWTIIKQVFSGWPGMPHHPELTTQPEVITIDLEDDKAGEYEYRKNKYIGNALVASIIGMIVYKICRMIIQDAELIEILTKMRRL